MFRDPSLQVGLMRSDHTTQTNLAFCVKYIRYGSTNVSMPLVSPQNDTGTYSQFGFLCEVRTDCFKGNDMVSPSLLIQPQRNTWTSTM